MKLNIHAAAKQPCALCGATRRVTNKQGVPLCESYAACAKRVAKGRRVVRSAAA